MVHSHDLTTIESKPFTVFIIFPVTKKKERKKYEMVKKQDHKYVPT